MPKIDAPKDMFFALLGRECDDGELQRILPTAKAELDGFDPETGVFRIELNDTNRPDLWSVAGLARQLKARRDNRIPEYDFFSTPKKLRSYGKHTVVVEPSVAQIRPFLTGFAISGPGLDEPTLLELIQLQEKLSWNFGRKRKTISMGIYRSDFIDFPIRYLAVDPQKARFVPLQMEEELNLEEILERHPKGIEYAFTLKGFKRYPYLIDSNDQVLSFPPIINSNHLGAVRVGDKELFIELTGDDMPVLCLATSIVACAASDLGFAIHPTQVKYEFDTPLGREMVFPYYFQQAIDTDLAFINKTLGIELSVEQAIAALKRMGCPAQANGSRLTVSPPEYRNDFLHPVDVAEDVAIGRGFETFEPLQPSDYTIGRLTEAESFGRRVKKIMVGLGFQEMIYNYLGSGKDYIDKMAGDGQGLLRIANPMTENYEYVRNSILPELLRSESVSSHAVYPHHIFEVGKVAFPDKAENYGSTTRNYLGFLNAEAKTGFTRINNQIAALMYYLGEVADSYNTDELNDRRYIAGRAAKIKIDGREIGYFGEIHPRILAGWGIEMVVTAAEIDLDLLLELTTAES